MNDSGSGSNCNEEMEGEKVFRVLRNTTANSPSKRIKCTFRLIPSETEICRDKLDDLIYNNGGDVLEETEKQCDYAINILNEKYFFDNLEKDCVLPWDTFSSVYIFDAVRSKQQKLPIPSINNYRLTDTRFESCNADKILFQKKKWSDLVPLKDRQHTNSGVKAQEIVSCWKKVIENSKTATEPQDQDEADIANNRPPEEQNIITEDHVESAPSATSSSSPIRKGRGRTRKTRILSSSSESSDDTVNEDNNTTDNESGRSRAKKRKVVKSSSEKVRVRQSNATARVAKESRSSNYARSRSESRNEDEDTDDTAVEMPPKEHQSPARSSQGKNKSHSATRSNEKVVNNCSSPRISNNTNSYDDSFIEKTPSPARTSQSRMRNNRSVRSETNREISNLPNNNRRQNDDDAANEVEVNRNGESASSVAETPQIKIVPNPKTSATVRPMNLVVRAVAGPSRDVTHKQAKQVKTANVAKTQRTGNDSDFLSCGDADDVSYEDSDVGSSRSESVHPRNKKGGPFTIAEGQLMLDLICENNAFMFTKGMKLWELLEKSGKFPRRTNQSLKEHFRKKVLPSTINSNSMTYRISPEHLRRLEKAQERIQWTKHANVCPDYTF